MTEEINHQDSDDGAFRENGGMNWGTMRAASPVRIHSVPAVNEGACNL